MKLAAKASPSTTAPLPEEVGGMIQKALAIRPDLAAKAEEVRASEAATRRAGADFLPEVRLEGNYAYSAFQYDSDTGPKSNSNAAGVNGYGAFLNVEWDLFDGFERVERLRKKSAEEQAARENLVTAQLDASRDVWTTYHDTLSAARRIDSAEAFVASAQENFSAIETSTRTGLSQISELAEAAGILAEARFERAEALAIYSTRLAELALAVGSMR
ncbi:MAG: TolC family protein [Spartobacteria bacterium]